MRHILYAIDSPQLVQSVNFRRKPSMQTKDLIFYFSSDRQALEEISKAPPNGISGILLETLIVKAIKFIDFSVLVVAAKDGDAAAVFDLEQQNVEEGLHAVESAVHIVAHKEVVCVLG